METIYSFTLRSFVSQTVFSYLLLIPLMRSSDNLNEHSIKLPLKLPALRLNVNGFIDRLNHMRKMINLLR